MSINRRHAVHDAGTMRGIMTGGTASVPGIVVALLQSLLIAVPAIWAGMALWYQAPGTYLKNGLMILWAAFNASLLIVLWRGGAGLALASFALAFAILLIWWRGLR